MQAGDARAGPAPDDAMTPSLPVGAGPDLSGPVQLESAQLHRLVTGTDRAGRGAAWLALQCGQVAGARQAALWDVTGGTLRLLATWPEGDAPAGQTLAEMEGAARLALRESRPIARGRGDLPLAPVVAVPVLPQPPAGAASDTGSDAGTGSPGVPRIAALAALALEGQPDAVTARETATAAIRRLQWGSGWLREDLRLREAGQARDADSRARVALEILTAALDHERFAEAAMAAVTELAIRADCSRVSVGFRRGHSVRVAAISHSARFGRGHSIARSLAGAMDEAIDQRATILYPAPDDRPLATMAHAALARLQGGGRALTIPMFLGDRFIGAFTFERADDAPFDAPLMELLDAAVALLAPMLEDKRLNARWLGAKAADSARQQLRNLFGFGHPVLKLSALLALAAILFLSLATGSYRVTAEAMLEGKERRAVTAAYDGFIRDSGIRAGDIVTAGEVLAQLDDRDFALDRLRRETEREQFGHQYDQALAARQPSLANVIRSQIAQADAQIRLIDEQIARTRLVAPFDGVVIAGDLTQRIGDAVSRGEVLFEIAPLTGYRVEMRVDEREVAALVAGQTGSVVFSALPDESFPVILRAVTPVAQVEGGRNLFRAEADLAPDPDATAPDPALALARLRPGMTGIAKIPVRQERLITIWTRPMVNWLRLAWWRWAG